MTVLCVSLKLSLEQADVHLLFSHSSSHLPDLVVLAKHGCLAQFQSAEEFSNTKATELAAEPPPEWLQNSRKHAIVANVMGCVEGSMLNGYNNAR